MKNIRTLVLIAVILVVGMGSSAMAQTKAQKTSGARAAYGYQPDDSHYRKMKKKSRKNSKKHQEAKRKKRSQDTGAAYRRRGFIM